MIQEITDKIFNIPIVKKYAWKHRNGIKDVSANLVQQAVSMALGIVSSILMARGLGPSGLGALTLVLSVSGMAASLTDLGINQTAIRYGARYIAQGRDDEAKATFRWALRLRVALILLASIIVYAFAPYLGTMVWKDHSLIFLLRLSIILGAIGAFSSFSQYYFQAYKRFTVNAGVKIVQAVVSFLGIIVLAWFSWWSPFSVLITQLVTIVIGTLILVYLIPWDVVFRLKDFTQGNKNILKRLFLFHNMEPSENANGHAARPEKFALFMMVSSVAAMLCTRYDSWFLGAQISNSAVGIYSVGMRFALPMMVLTSALNSALWPRVSGLTEKKDLIKLYWKLFKISGPIAAASLLYSVFAPLTAPFLFGKEFSGSVLPAQIICVTYSIVILFNPLSLIGYGFELANKYSIVNVVQAIIGVLLFPILISRFNVVGAALAFFTINIIGTFIISALVIYIIKKPKIA